MIAERRRRMIRDTATPPRSTRDCYNRRARRHPRCRAPRDSPPRPRTRRRCARSSTGSARRRPTSTRFAARRSSSRSAARSSPTTSFLGIVHDLNLLHSLGIQLVVVHGCRPQIEAILKQQDIPSRYAHGVRVTDADDDGLRARSSGPGAARASRRCSRSASPTRRWPARAIACRAATTSRPSRWACVDGVDMQLTGEVRRIDTEAIQQRLDDGDIVLISPIGYSPTGEIFNLTRRGSGDAGRRAAERASSSSS